MTSPVVEDSRPYTLAGLRQMLGLSRHAISKLIELGFVEPSRGPGRSYRFSFRDVVLLRSAHELRIAGIATREILRSLRRLREALPAEMPVSGLRVTAVGDRVAVRELSSQNEAPWEVRSGQRVLDFSVAPASGSVSFLTARPEAVPDDRANADVDELFAAAEELEETDAAEAESVYRQVLALAPGHAHAYLNLGFMLCEAKRCEEAVALYDEAVEHCADDPLVHYNRAVALEALERIPQALASYERSLKLQPDLVDAHQNAALLYARTGQPQLAIRHFSAYRRLQPKPH